MLIKHLLAPGLAVLQLPAHVAFKEPSSVRLGLPLPPLPLLCA
jgi:hypothetical protein